MEKYCTQIKIIVSLYGENFNPLDFSEYVKITPTDFWNKGDEIPQRKGLVRKGDIIPLRKENAWEYSTDFIKTLYFDEVSEIIIHKFREKTPEINNYIKQNELDVKIDIVVEIADNQTPALTFNRSFLALTSQLKAEMDIDIYLINSN